MSSPLPRFRLLPLLCTGFLASLCLSAVLAGSRTPARGVPPTPHEATATTLPLSSDGGGAEMMYVSLPGIGNAVMSLGSDGKPVFSPVTLHQDELTFSRDGHQLNLSGIRLPEGSSSRPFHLVVHLNPGNAGAPAAPAALPASHV